MPIHFKFLTSQELAVLPPESTVFIFPAGSLEDHGPVLPLGLKTLEAEWLAEACAERIEKEMKGWTSCLMPCAPAAVQSITTKYSISTRGYVLRDWLVDSCKHLIRLRFKHFLCISGNTTPRQLTAIEEAGKIIQKPFGIFRRGNQPRLHSVSSALTSWNDVKKAPLWPDPPEHAGKRDVSVALSIAKGRVDPSYSALPSSEKPILSTVRLFERISGKQGGYWGNPGQASVEEGKKVLGKTLDSVFPKILRALDGNPPGSDFRSWYSLFPPNRSFFKSWLLFYSVIFLVAAYIYVFQLLI